MTSVIETINYMAFIIETANYTTSVIEILII